MRSPILFYTLMANNVTSDQPAKMFTEANYITLTTEHKRVTINSLRHLWNCFSLWFTTMCM